MDIKKVLLRIAGKDNLEIDKQITISYLLRMCWKYGWMMLRGRWISLFYKNMSNKIFIGRKVSLIMKNKMFLGKGVKIHDFTKIDALSRDGVRFGDGVIIGRNTTIECTGSIEYLGKGLTIGNQSTFNNDCFFGAAGGIEIGENVVAGQFIRFHSENHNYDRTDMLIKEQGTTHKGIKLGNNCWIGSGVVFLDGAEIGDGCVVAANTVVTKKFGDNCVLAGIPAKVVKMRG